MESLVEVPVRAATHDALVWLVALTCAGFFVVAACLISIAIDGESRDEKIAKLEKRIRDLEPRCAECGELKATTNHVSTTHEFVPRSQEAK